MIDIGRVCMKIAGRDAGKYCVIVKKIDDNYVLIDGQTRRKKCNVKHLEPINKKIKIKKDAPHSTIVSELKKLEIIVEPKEKRPKKSLESSSKNKKK
ncbi:MAG: 50S ribosomal protein L14e [Candidatus Woesearchaeota archaeon]|nr:50S ribosomal protein L14e [Candidatus Woesearchaeota archaeon]